MKIINVIISAVIILFSCNSTNIQNQNLTDTQIWSLGWRMIENSWNENYQMAEIQFDSLIPHVKKLDPRFVITGMEVLNKLKNNGKLSEILNNLDETVLQDICSRDLFTTQLIEEPACQEIKNEEVSNPALQLELIKMYVNDQYARSNLMEDLLEKYNLDKDEVLSDSKGLMTDKNNRNRLKEIVNKYGFPSKQMVGKDAMKGIFLMIQHSDGDKAWQKLQLPFIEKAVKNGDLDGQSYAYLYDRIKINSGEKQLYGTQFSKVDPINKVVELAATEDIENLDKRRIKVGMMPVEMYKRVMLKNL